MEPMNQDELLRKVAARIALFVAMKVVIFGAIRRLSRRLQEES